MLLTDSKILGYIQNMKVISAFWLNTNKQTNEWTYGFKAKTESQLKQKDVIVAIVTDKYIKYKPGL